MDDLPVNDPPVDDPPVDDPPVDDPPVDDPPVDDPPVDDPPVDDPPVDDPPVDDPPVDDPPVDDPPVDDPPVDDPPVDDPPVDDPPVDDPPVDDPPVDDPPVDDPPVDDPPVDDPPVDDPPVDDPPVDDPPVDDPPVDDDWNPGDEVEDDPPVDDPPADDPPAEDDPPVDDPPADDPPAEDDPPNQSQSRLYEGAGFDGPAVELDPVGDPMAPGYDCKAIARWDVVPWQDTQDGFTVGVVAYHREGIAWVDFSLNGGPWVRVTEPLENARTGEIEYFAELALDVVGASDLEIRAVVVPNSGIPRVLSGPISQASLASGEHSMCLRAPDVRPEFFVSPNGSDTTGDGSRDNPFRTIPHAVFYGAGGGISGTDASGSILTLLPGDYHYDFGNNNITLSNGWLTVRSDDPVPSSATRFTSYADRAFLDKIHIKCMQFDQPEGETHWASFYGSNQLWIDNCDLQGGFVYTGMLAGYAGKWATDCTALNMSDKPFGSVITRNCHVEGLLSDAFGPEDLLLNSSVTRQSPHQSSASAGAHPDVWQKRNPDGIIENVILRDVTALVDIEAQGLFFAGASAGYFDVALVNVNIDNSWTFNGQGPLMTCFTVYNPMKHVLLYDSSMQGGFMAGPGASFGVLGDLVLTDVVFKNNILLNPINYIEGSDVFLPQPDGGGSDGAWPGIWRGPNLDPLPWTSPSSNILYLE